MRSTPRSVLPLRFERALNSMTDPVDQRTHMPMSGRRRCQTPLMVTSSAERRRARRQRATEVFGKHADAAIDALALLDFAWHDCYGEPSPSDTIMEDIWEVSGGNLAQFIVAAHLAVIDFRDLRVWADRQRKGN